MAGLDERSKRIIERGKQHPEPRFEAETGTPGRLISGRLQQGTDLLTGLKTITKAYNILAGAIVVSFGSLARAEVTWTEGSKSSGNRKNERLQIEGPVSFLSSQGKVGMSEDGEPYVHLHGIFADRDGKTWGGHFHDGNNPVFSTFEVVIQEIKDIRHTKVWDEDSEVKLLKAVRL